MSKRFFCLCMSPAIDATVKLPAAPTGAGEIFKDVAEEENVGGKGINVARWLALRGAQVACGGLLGEDNAAPFVREMAKYGIEDCFVRVPGATRRNEMITWPGGSVKLNRSAFPGLADMGGRDVLSITVDCSRLQSWQHPPARDVAAAEGSRVAILSGSLPAAAGVDFYAKAVRHLKAEGWFVALDASGEPMRLALDEHPDLIKPNADECEALVGFIPKTPDDFKRATALLREKAAHAIISDGGAGAWFDGEFVPAPKVDVVDTTAAGDTLLAEYCHGNDPRWAVAAGSAACLMPGGAPPPLETVERLYSEVP